MACDRDHVGQDVPAVVFSHEDRRRYRDKVRQCLDALARMLGEDRFEGEQSLVGLEVELNLVDPACDPAMKNAEVLAAVADAAWVTEVGQVDVEVSIEPLPLARRGLPELAVGV